MFMLCLIIFLLNKTSTNSLYLIFLTTFLFTPFACLTSSLSTETSDYIFNFNPTNSLIIFPSNPSFILPITFLLAGSKNFEFNE